MKIKDKKSGEVYEAETWRNLNGVSQYVKKGTNGPIRYADEVEIIEEDKPKDATDWESFRREAAKDILAGLAASGLGVNLDLDPAFAVKLADELIKQLKEK